MTRAHACTYSEARNTERIAGALVLLLVPAIFVKFAFNGSRISFTAINLIQFTLMASLLNLTVHVAAKIVRWAPTQRRVGRPRRASLRHAAALPAPATPPAPESRPPVG